ncbi:MAG: CvpA family protein [Eubacteriales bacterium]|nr:CvpA family protein [Eubacteriales bacterium]
MTTVDWIILLVIVIYAILGFRKGFVATVVSALGSLAALVLALLAASRLKEPVGALIAPHLTEPVQESFHLDTLATSADALWNSMSGYLQNILSDHGVTAESLEASNDPATALLGGITATVGESLAYVLVFILAFILLRIAIHYLLILLNVITRLPVIHSANALLGGALGVVTGLALCTIVLWAMKLVVPSTYSDAGILSPSVMSRSTIASTLVGWNDGVSLFETAPTTD